MKEPSRARFRGLQSRCATAGPSASRGLRIHPTKALATLPESSGGLSNFCVACAEYLQCRAAAILPCQIHILGCDWFVQCVHHVICSISFYLKPLCLRHQPQCTNMHSCQQQCELTEDEQGVAGVKPHKMGFLPILHVQINACR